MQHHVTKPRFSGLIVIMLIISAALAWKYYDLRSEIHLVRLESMASSLNAASANNFAAALTGSDQALSIHNCRDAAGLLQGISGYNSGESPFTKAYEGYHIQNLEHNPQPGNYMVMCELANSRGNSAGFNVYYTLMD
ncbi:hypothetical protein [Desulfonatronospira sp.]|uniref:hypothetical protein n=1 Tax=Desulfonatronospira sp. TaxID=1962951 RepID=UPI0025C0DC58|nr:hypothetical protein [Desulfonatronospira sp.]